MASTDLKIFDLVKDPAKQTDLLYTFKNQSLHNVVTGHLLQTGSAAKYMSWVAKGDIAYINGGLRTKTFGERLPYLFTDAPFNQHLASKVEKPITVKEYEIRDHIKLQVATSRRNQDGQLLGSPEDTKSWLMRDRETLKRSLDLSMRYICWLVFGDSLNSDGKSTKTTVDDDFLNTVKTYLDVKNTAPTGSCKFPPSGAFRFDTNMATIENLTGCKDHVNKSNTTDGALDKFVTLTRLRIRKNEHEWKVTDGPYNTDTTLKTPVKETLTWGYNIVKTLNDMCNGEASAKWNMGYKGYSFKSGATNEIDDTNKSLELNTIERKNLVLIVNHEQWNEYASKLYNIQNPSVLELTASSLGVQVVTDPYVAKDSFFIMDKRAVNIWFTYRRSGSQEFPQQRVTNYFDDLDFFIGTWPFHTCVYFKKGT